MLSNDFKNLLNRAYHFTFVSKYTTCIVYILTGLLAKIYFLDKNKKP